MPDPMKITQTLNKNYQEKGQSLLEFAVSLIVILILLSGIIDLGRMFFTYIAMRDAAQEGVMYGIIEPTKCSDIINRAEALLSDEANITVLINNKDCSAASPSSDACSSKTIKVNVNDPDFPITMPFVGTFLGRNSINLDASVTGTILSPQCITP